MRLYVDCIYQREVAYEKYAEMLTSQNAPFHAKTASRQNGPGKVTSIICRR